MLALRDDVKIRVFFTWHGGGRLVEDRGFQRTFAWDIPLTDGYESEAVPNVARTPGTHHFFGLRNPELIRRVMLWKPDVVHLTGYAYASHMNALRACRRLGVPVLFRGDSHLLDTRRSDWRWVVKRTLLRTVFSWPSGFLTVGQANRAYYEAMGVPDSKLYPCPHSIEVARFAEPHATLEKQALDWRKELGIADDRIVVLFAGKFEDKKRPVALMQAVRQMADSRILLLMVGDGALAPDVRGLAAEDPQRFRVLPFQNQSRMPVVYRLGDLFVLPSAYGETWGLAVNEAMACSRPALVSDRVGSALDLLGDGACGAIFPADNWQAFAEELHRMTAGPDQLKATGKRALAVARQFDIASTAEGVLNAVNAIRRQPGSSE